MYSHSQGCSNKYLKYLLRQQKLYVLTNPQFINKVYGTTNPHFTIKQIMALTIHTSITEQLVHKLTKKHFTITKKKMQQTNHPTFR